MHCLEPLLFPEILASLVLEPIAISEVIDGSPADDTPGADDFTASTTIAALAAAPTAASAPASTTSLASKIRPTSPTSTLAPQEDQGLRRSTRQNRGVPPTRMADMLMAANPEIREDDPKTYKQAMKLPDAAKWKGAHVAKVASLVEKKVFEVVDRLATKPVITSKWVFKIIWRHRKVQGTAGDQGFHARRRS